MSRTACSGSAVVSTIMAFSPPVSAISGAAGSRCSAIARLIFNAVSVDPVNATPFTRGSDVSAAPTVAVAGQKLERGRRHAGLVQQVDGERGDQRRLFGRLGENGIASGERRRDLAGEDRERKVPGADAGEGAARRVDQARAPVPRSSAGNRPPRAIRRRHRPGSCPPRAPEARRSDRNSPHRGRPRGSGSRHVRRGGGPGRCGGAGRPPCRRALAGSTWPTGAPVAGLVTAGAARPRPARRAAGGRRTAPRGAAARAASMAARSPLSVRSNPRELRRWPNRPGPVSDRGVRHRGHCSIAVSGQAATCFGRHILVRRSG